MTDTLLLNMELEQHVIGAVLTDTTQYILISEYLSAEDFGYLRHRYIWTAMGHCSDEDETFDYATVAKRLFDDGSFKQSDWGMREIYAYLMDCINNTPGTYMAETYARLVWRISQRRQLLDTADEIKKVAVDESITLPDVMEKAEGLIRGLASQTVERSEVTIGEALSAAIDSIEAREANRFDFYLPTGYKGIDQFCSGLERGNVHVIGAKPNIGKTSLCMGMAVNGSRLDVRTGFISNEMSVDRLAMRIAAIEGEINLQALKRGEITDQERARFIESIGRIADIPLMLDYIPWTTIAQVHAKVLRLKRERGLDVLFIDGLWRMQAPEFRGDKNQRNEVNGFLMDSLSDIAKKQNIAIVVTHQCTKAIDYRQDKRPTKGDLDYGGKIDQSADMIIMLYRDEAYNEGTEFPNQAELIFDKNRDGPTGMVTLFFDKRTTRFSDMVSEPIDLSSRSQPFIYQESNHDRANPDL